MLDSDLAALYGVETGELNQATKRNTGRFPADFMFALSEDKHKGLLSQSVITNPACGGRRRSLPNVFMEQGIAMLSSVLRSEGAVQVNIAIMRAFVQMRRLTATPQELARKIMQREQKYDEQFGVVFRAIQQLIGEPSAPERRMGFHRGKEGS